MVNETSHMFITGPDVIKTVTGEEVGLRGARRRDVARVQVRRGAVRRRRRGRLPGGRSLPAHVPAPEQPGVGAAGAVVGRSGPDGRRARLDRPRRRQQAVRHPRRGAVRGRRRRVHGSARALRAEHRRRLLAAERDRDRRRRQPAEGDGRRAGHRRLGQGRALRALLRRVQPADPDLRRRARVPARHLAGVGRDHPPRREAAVRLRRGDRAEDHRDHAQGLRRRLRRHVVQAPALGLQLRVADGRDRRHGPRGRGEHHPPPRHRPVTRRRTSAAGS